MIILEENTGPPITVTGIADTEIENLPICTAAGLVKTIQGPIIGIFNQYAKYRSKGSIHSPLQMGVYGLDVNEKAKRAPGGRQTIVTPEGYVIPLSMRQGLAYMQTQPPTEEELQNLPHIHFTSNEHWDPRVYDNESVSSLEEEEMHKPWQLQSSFNQRIYFLRN